MMNKLFLITLCAVGAMNSINAKADAMNGMAQPPTQPVIETVPEGTTFPMLDMTYDCGDCKPDSKIKALVEGTFLDQAEKEKAKIDDTQTITLKVSKYRSRGKARFFVGALAGADTIQGIVSCNGVDKEIGDTAVSAVNGIESVARNVGQEAYKTIKACVMQTSAPEVSASTPSSN